MSYRKSLDRGVPPMECELDIAAGELQQANALGERERDGREVTQWLSEEDDEIEQKGRCKLRIPPPITKQPAFFSRAENEAEVKELSGEMAHKDIETICVEMSEKDGNDEGIEGDPLGKNDSPSGRGGKSPRFRRMPSMFAPAFNFSFSGAGWLQFYLFGVATCLRDHGFTSIDERQIFIGASAGALAAACLALDASFDECVEYSKNVAIPLVHASPYNAFKVTELLQNSLSKLIKFGLVHELIHGELIVGVTRLRNLKNERITHFPTSEFLKTCLIASAACVPLARPIKLNGVWYIDGGYTEHQPRLPSQKERPDLLETIYVQSLYFADDCDIRPSQAIPWSWTVVPPKDPEAIDWLFGLGYRDALRWMERRGLSQCCSHSPSSEAGSKRCILECSMCPSKGKGPTWETMRTVDLLFYTAAVVLLQPIITLELVTRIAVSILCAFMKELAPALLLVLIPMPRVCLVLLTLLLTRGLLAVRMVTSSSALNCWEHITDLWEELKSVFTGRWMEFGIMPDPRGGGQTLRKSSSFMLRGGATCFSPCARDFENGARKGKK